MFDAATRSTKPNGGPALAIFTEAVKVVGVFGSEMSTRSDAGRPSASLQRSTDTSRAALAYALAWRDSSSSISAALASRVATASAAAALRHAAAARGSPGPT